MGLGWKRNVMKFMATETKKRERKEYLKWRNEIEQEGERREAIETKKRETDEFLKWDREIKENELALNMGKPILISSAIHKNTQKWLPFSLNLHHKQLKD